MNALDHVAKQWHVPVRIGGRVRLVSDKMRGGVIVNIQYGGYIGVKLDGDGAVTYYHPADLIYVFGGAA